jgi:hypothetical protein
MFPTVRLMIAATLASVVALICGFGMFAVFHVGHEPLVRLPATTAPLQLVADNTLRTTVGLTSSDVFDVRFAVKAPSHPAEAAIAPAANEPRATEGHATEAPEAEPEPAAKPDAAGPEHTSSTTGETTETMPALSEAEPSADDQADRAAPPQPESTFSTMPAAAASPPPDTTASGPELSIKAPVMALAAEDSAPTPAVETATNGPANPPAASRQETDPVSQQRISLATAPAGTASSTGPGFQKAAVKKPKRTHTVVRPLAPRLVVVRYVRVRYRQAQYAQAADQGIGTTQDQNFQMAPTQYGAMPRVRVRYLRIVVRKTVPPAAGIGGPLVRVPRP